MRMRKITFSKYGVHFETNAGAINAHWRDLFGIGLCKSIPYHTLKSVRRFWEQVFRGIKFLIIKDIFKAQ